MPRASPAPEYLVDGGGVAQPTDKKLPGDGRSRNMIRTALCATGWNVSMAAGHLPDEMELGLPELGAAWKQPRAVDAGSEG
jgi:hypothetical protein